jgi:ribosome recycling factor
MPDALKPVMTAINESGMNLSPQQEGTIIYLPIPKVTREHREGLAKNAKVICQRAKDELKDIHSSFSSYVKKQKKGHVSEELIFNVNENLKYLIDLKIAECDELLDHKINDLLK